MRWKAFFFLNGNTGDTGHENYGFRSNKFPPAINELKEFEEKMTNLIQNIEFGNKNNVFQQKLTRDLKAVKSQNKLMIKADKTINYYKMDQRNYAELVNTNLTKTYKKTTKVR